MILNKILAPCGVQRPIAQVDLAFEEADNQAKTEDYRLSYTEFWRLYNRRVLECLGVSRNLKEISNAITNNWWDNADLELYPEVKWTLQALNDKGLKIGIVTNGFQLDIQMFCRELA